MALVLSRRTGESLLIGDNVRVTVSRVGRGDRVQMRIEAPKHVRVTREEIADRKEDGDDD